MEAARHPADQLLHTSFPLGRPHVAAEILRHHHIRRELRPALRDLAVRLLEDRLAELARDLRAAQLPLHACVRVVTRTHEMPGNLHSASARTPLGRREGCDHTRLSHPRRRFALVPPEPRILHALVHDPPIFGLRLEMSLRLKLSAASTRRPVSCDATRCWKPRSSALDARLPPSSKNARVSLRSRADCD